jgi:hypothetical protein
MVGKFKQLFLSFKTLLKVMTNRLEIGLLILVVADWSDRLKREVIFFDDYNHEWSARKR